MWGKIRIWGFLGDRKNIWNGCLGRTLRNQRWGGWWRQVSIYPNIKTPVVNLSYCKYNKNLQRLTKILVIIKLVRVFFEESKTSLGVFFREVSLFAANILEPTERNFLCHLYYTGLISSSLWPQNSEKTTKLNHNLYFRQLQRNYERTASPSLMLCIQCCIIFVFAITIS